MSPTLDKSNWKDEFKYFINRLYASRVQCFNNWRYLHKNYPHKYKIGINVQDDRIYLYLCVWDYLSNWGYGEDDLMSCFYGAAVFREDNEKTWCIMHHMVWKL